MIIYKHSIKVFWNDFFIYSRITFLIQVWENESPQTVSNVQKRGLKGDFLASVIRNDPKDRRLAKVFKRNYDLITKETARRHPLVSNDSFSQNRLFNLENVEISQINGLRFPSIGRMVQLSQLWMSDHSQFWYFLQNEVKQCRIISSKKNITETITRN